MKNEAAAGLLPPYASDARGVHAGEMVTFQDVIGVVDGSALNGYLSSVKAELLNKDGTKRELADGLWPFIMKEEDRLAGSGTGKKFVPGKTYPDVSQPLALLTESRTRLLLEVKMQDGPAGPENVKAALDVIYNNWDETAQLAGVRPDAMRRIDVEMTAQKLLEETPKGSLCITPGELLENRRERAMRGNAFWQGNVPAAKIASAKPAGAPSFGMSAEVPDFLAMAAAGSLEKASPDEAPRLTGRNPC